MNTKKLTSDTDCKIKWWENELLFWLELSEKGEFVNEYTGEIKAFDPEQFALVKDEIIKCEKHLEYYYGIKEVLEKYQSGIEYIYGKEK